MITGKTSTGFEYTVDPIIVRDMEFIELAAETMDNGLKLPELIKYVLGAEQKEKLYEHVRNDKGRVILDDVNREVSEILDVINAHKETKNL